MGWFDRLFGKKNDAAPAEAAPAPAPGETIPPERVGINGEYDQSGLAKRVALAFDNDASITDIETLWVAQTGSKVVLKGKVPDQGSLNKMVSVASGVSGATEVDTSQVTIG
ncbi:phospholipid-binding protein [Leptolyngbya ohadii]|uniref:phospholipid-binding protein n=1 Tax=Leptolyngbya ohadii TaxID=1962290 RepID=UPI000B59F4BD|nr:phospholipid-binding protein [Leptolyngbya ohadii]